MSVLTFDVGGAALSVACERAGHAAPRLVGGGRGFAFAGRESSGTRGQAMVVPVVLAPLPSATVATIRAMFALGAQVPCAGDVFNNGGGTALWSADITDELHETADRWTMSMTLYEIAPSATSTLSTTLIYLTTPTSVDDPGDDSLKLAKVGVGGSGFADLDTVRVLDSVLAAAIECGDPMSPDPTTACPTVTSTTPEKSWLTLPLAATEIIGLMTVTFLSKGGTGDKWAHQGVMAKIFLVRGGVDVKQANTAYAATNGGFAGSSISMTTTGAVAWVVEDGDKIRVEVWGRLALHSGYLDGNDGSNLDRQTLTYGWSGASNLSKLSVGGVVTLL
jgi:hypothetical protein